MQKVKINVSYAVVSHNLTSVAEDTKLPLNVKQDFQHLRTNNQNMPVNDNTTMQVKWWLSWARCGNQQGNVACKVWQKPYTSSVLQNEIKTSTHISFTVWLTGLLLRSPALDPWLKWVHLSATIFTIRI